MQARVGRKLVDRIEALPATVRDIAWKGQLRLCQRYRHMMAAGKPKVVATTAIAREMVGFIWAIARAVTPAQRLTPDHRNQRALILPMCRAGGGTRWGTLGKLYEPLPRIDARSLERGSPRTKPRSCGIQPAYESLLNRRLSSAPCPAHPYNVATGEASGDLLRATG